MNFSTDRDLLVYEPSLFKDVAFVGQQVVSVTDGVLSGTSLQSITADFVEADIETGHVAMINNVPFEVVNRVSANELEVSLLRTQLSDSAIPGQDGSGLAVTVHTFGPQISVVHEGLMTLLGADRDEPGKVLSDDAVVSVTVMARLETLGTLERIYSGVMVFGEASEDVLLRANRYRRMFEEARARAIVMVDIDGDGYADERRSLGLIRFMRT
ncbi:hypothetical protein [Poriferisphaera sp. WC338]|uniref:hypothetical protein n=1 Tax=Poriferisphaera sp. WC338 TaxID=3425129 RepID=UPI003D817111